LFAEYLLEVAAVGVGEVLEAADSDALALHAGEDLVVEAAVGLGDHVGDAGVDVLEDDLDGHAVGPGAVADAELDLLLQPADADMIMTGAAKGEFILAEQTHAAVREVRWQAAVLPFGATEPHNLHMPYGTDTFQVEELARRACGHAWQKGAKVALLPALPY